MSFLDEGTFVGKGAVKDALKDPEFKALKGDEKAKALQTLKMGGSITTEKKGKELTGDGKIDSKDYLAARDAAIKKAKSMKEGVAKDLEIKAMEASSLEEFLDDVYQDYPQHKGNFDIKDFLTKYYLNAGGPLDEISEGKLANALGGVALLAGLLLMNKINSNDPVVQRLQNAYEQAEGNKAAQDSIKDLISKRLIFLDSGEFDNTTPMKENAIANFIRGRKYGGPVSDFLDDLSNFDTDNDKNLEDDELELDTPDRKKKFNELDFIEKLSKGEVKEDEYKAVLKRLEKINPKPTDMIKAIKDAYTAGQRTNEAKTIELPADTTFTVDLKHLMKKHMDEGKSKEDTIKFTKALMAKLHNKGEVTVDGTKIVFKEGKKKSGYMGYTDMANEASIMGIPLESFADYYTALDLAKNIGVPVVAFSALLAIMGVQRATEFLKKGKEAVMDWYEQNKLNEQEDAQLALPEPDAPDYLGDDGMDYEGGMAKSQMLKMKKYAMALCDMIDDESQLESWVQAKLTKASDYMSSVYHYLDYRKSKMNELNEDEGQNIADFLNANYKEIASKLGNPGSNFEIIGDNKVATAGDGNEGIDISFDKNHMDKLFPKDDPYNEVKELTIAGKVVYYNDYRGSKMNEAFELNGREVVDLEADGGGSIDPFIGAAYYLDTGKKLTDDEIEALVDKYPADLELGGAWWDQQR